MQRTCDQLFTGATFACNHDSGGRRRYPANQGKDPLHGWRLPHEIAEDPREGKLAAKFLVLDRQFAVRAREFQQKFERGEIDWLLQKPESIQLVDGMECFLQAAKSSH